MGIPRSTVSARDAELEARLGVSLVKRTTRRLHLTDAGRDYFEAAKRSLEAIEAAERALKGSETEVRGRLRIAAATNMGRVLSATRSPTSWWPIRRSRSNWS